LEGGHFSGKIKNMQTDNRALLTKILIGEEKGVKQFTGGGQTYMRQRRLVAVGES